MSPAANVALGPAVVNVSGVRAGDRNLITLTLTSNGNPVNITGMTLTSQVRRSVIDADPPALVADVVILNGPGGVASITWPGDDVRTLLAGAAAWSGVWDVQMQSGSADPVTVAAGTWAAEMDVTR